MLEIVSERDREARKSKNERENEKLKLSILKAEALRRKKL